MDDVFRDCLFIIEDALTSIAVYKGMKKIYDVKNSGGLLDMDAYNWGKSVFIINLNNSAQNAIIRVSNLLGQDGEDFHWKKIFSEFSSFKNNCILCEFRSENDWKTYHTELISFRNDLVVHRKFDRVTIMPFFDVSLKMLINIYQFIASHFSTEISEENYIINSFVDLKLVYESIYSATIDFYQNIDLNINNRVPEIER